jgi:hypothetical protein
MDRDSGAIACWLEYDKAVCAYPIVPVADATYHLR